MLRKTFNTLVLTAFIILLMFMQACTNIQNSTGNDADNPLSMAVLYNYYSSEYRALCYQAYNQAEEYIKKISEIPGDIGSKAIIVDIDETILDNSPYQAKTIVGNFSYPDGWNEWCNQAVAEPVPGSLAFLRMADSLGFAIFYISNRKEEAVLDGTIKNLRNAGFPQATCENVLLRQKKGSQNPDPSDKQARRDIVRNKGFEIVLMAGDNLGDFYTDRLKEDARHKMLDSIRGKLGKEYIIVPNAMYGNWPAAAGIDSNSMIEKLDSMSSIFNYR